MPDSHTKSISSPNMPDNHTKSSNSPNMPDSHTESSNNTDTPHNNNATFSTDGPTEDIICTDSTTTRTLSMSNPAHVLAATLCACVWPHLPPPSVPHILLFLDILTPCLEQLHSQQQQQQVLLL
jgi:hypothetical protein